MKKTLYIFVYSHIPDGYVNAISHCIDNYCVERIVLLDILKDLGKTTEREGFLNELKEKIIKQFELLTDGKYLAYNNKTRKFSTEDIDINKDQRKRYSNYILKIPKQNIYLETIPYHLLDSKIQEYVSNGECYFDVTTTLKGYLLDIFMVILSKHLRHIYTFELLKDNRTYDDRDLIHNLTLDITYKYTNLTSTLFTTDKIVVGENEATKSQEIVSSLENGIEKLATNYSSNILKIYLLTVLAALIGIVYYILNKDWNWLEPRTYILSLPLLSYIIDLIITITTNKELSLKPSKLKNFFYQQKRKKLKATLTQ